MYDYQANLMHTVKPRPEAHMDMILFEVFLKSIDLIQNNRYYNGTIYIIDNVIVLSDHVESSGYASKTLKKGSCPYASLGRQNLVSISNMLQCSGELKNMAALTL